MNDVLDRLFATILARKGDEVGSSYTASLLSKGPSKCAEKFGEEAIEAIVSAAQGDRKNLTLEAADVLYHLQVMLAASSISWDDVKAELSKREGVSGHAEKAARKPDV